MSKSATMWNGNFGQVSATKHRIQLPAKTTPIHLSFYLVGSRRKLLEREKSTRYWKTLLLILLEQNGRRQSSLRRKTMAVCVFAASVWRLIRSRNEIVTTYLKCTNVSGESNPLMHSVHWMATVAIGRLIATKTTRTTRCSSCTTMFIGILEWFFDWRMHGHISETNGQYYGFT